MEIIGLAFIIVMIVCMCLYAGNKSTIELLQQDKEELYKHNGELAEALRKLSHEQPVLKMSDLLIHRSNVPADTSGCILVLGSKGKGRKAWFDEMKSELKEREAKEGTTHRNVGNYKGPNLSNEEAKAKAIKAEERKRRTNVWELVRNVMSYYFMRNRTHSVVFHLRTITDSIDRYKKGNSKHSHYKILTNIAANAIAALESYDNELPYSKTPYSDNFVTGEAQQSEGPLRYSPYLSVRTMKNEGQSAVVTDHNIAKKYKLYMLAYNPDTGIWSWIWRQGYPTKFAHSGEELIRQLDEQQGYEIDNAVQEPNDKVEIKRKPSVPQLTPRTVYELMERYGLYELDELPGVPAYKFRYRWPNPIEFADSYHDLINKLENHKTAYKKSEALKKRLTIDELRRKYNVYHLNENNGVYRLQYRMDWHSEYPTSYEALIQKLEAYEKQDQDAIKQNK